MANDHEDVSLDVLYSPSSWSSRLSADVIVDHHIKVLHEATLAAREQLRCELNIQYDFESGQLLDIYYATPPELGTLNVLIYIHGGYWSALSKNYSGFIAPLLAKHGFVTVALGYDIAPKGSMTTIVDQCRKGCAFVKNRFKDARLFVAGHSAGAHLAACVMSTDFTHYGLDAAQPLTGAVLLSGIYDLKPIKLTYVNNPLNLTQEEVESYSPHYHIAEVAKEMKVLMSHGEEDSPPFKSQGNDYFKCLTEAGVETSIHIVKEDHFSLTERLCGVDPTYSLQQILVDFLVKS